VDWLRSWKGETMSKGKAYKSASEALGVAPFYPEMERRELANILGETFILKDGKIVEGYRSEFGESDFALMLFEDAKGDKFTTICSGEVVLKKLRKLMAEKLLPVYATVVKPEKYYDLL